MKNARKTNLKLLFYLSILNLAIKMLITTLLSDSKQHTSFKLKGGGNGGGTNDGGYIWVG